MTGNTIPAGASRFHYQQLNDHERELYLAIEKMLMQDRCDFSVVVPIGVDMKKILNSIAYDNPLTYPYRKMSYTVSGGIAHFDINTNVTPTEISHNNAVLEKLYLRFAEDTAGMTDFEKELYIHDWMVTNMTYDLNDPDCFTIIGPAIRGHGVCGGFSFLAMYLLNRLGVECGIVICEVARDDRTDLHAFNIVRISGEYSFMDVTWDMPSVYSEYIRHDYFNVNLAVIGKTHHLLDSVPEASITKNYHTARGTVIYRIADIRRVLDAKIPEKEGILEFRLSAPLMGHYTMEMLSKDVRDSVSRRKLHIGYRCFYNSLTGCAVVEFVRYRCVI